MVRAHHHIDHGHDASVPKKGQGRAVPNEPWEKIYSLCEPSKRMDENAGSDFNAMPPTRRMRMYKKVNETDT